MHYDYTAIPDAEGLQAKPPPAARRCLPPQMRGVSIDLLT
jgi:hypothetical protein